MGLVSWVEHTASSAAHGLVHGVEHGAQALAHGASDVAGYVEHGVSDAANAVKEAWDLNFADGSMPSGTNPAQIYSWFHDGPGTPSYQGAQQNLVGLAASHGAVAEHVTAAHRALGSGWSGSAAEAARGATAPLAPRFSAMQQGASTAHGSVGDQVGTFGTTKNKVVQVPAKPPSGGGLSTLTSPVSMVMGISSDANVAAYQANTHTNQDAYQGYQGQTSPQSGELPEDQAKAASAAPDTGIAQGSVDPGRQYTRYSANLGGTSSQAYQPQRYGSSAPAHAAAPPSVRHTTSAASESTFSAIVAVHGRRA
ncbi:MAG: hypothetical protein ACRDRL_23450, partial [Sciscionella sp.]